MRELRFEFPVDLWPHHHTTAVNQTPAHTSLLVTRGTAGKAKEGVERVISTVFSGEVGFGAHLGETREREGRRKRPDLSVEVGYYLLVLGFWAVL